MTEGLKVRGSLLKGYGKYIKKMWGQKGLDDCCRAINFDRNALVQGRWYDANLITRMFEWMDRTHGREYIERAGNYAVKDLGILSYLLSFSSFEALLKRAPEQYAEAFSYGEVEIRIQKGGILISPMRAARSGWDDAARALRAKGGDELLDPPTPTRFDEEDWQW